jgi:hypothetical protein
VTNEDRSEQGGAVLLNGAEPARTAAATLRASSPGLRAYANRDAGRRLVRQAWDARSGKRSRPHFYQQMRRDRRESNPQPAL